MKLAGCMVMALIALPMSKGAAQEPARGVHWVVDSGALPCVSVRVDPTLDFLGHAEGRVMNDRAHAERFLFGEVVDGRLVRAAIVHFEGMVATDGSFEYPRFRMDTIAGDEYLHQVWPIADFDLFHAPPLDSLLATRHVTAESDWLVNRWVRVVDADRRHELLLFYLEPASVVGVAMTTLSEDWLPQGIAGDSHLPLEQAFIRRARAAVTVDRGPCGSPARPGRGAQ